MKYLQDYITDKQTEAYNKYKAFFAFSDEQLKEGLDKFNLTIEECCPIGYGLYCSKLNNKKLRLELNNIYKEGVEQDIKENGKEAIIVRELLNHEAYYTYDIEDTYDALDGYNITREMIMQMLNNKNHKFN